MAMRKEFRPFNLEQAKAGAPYGCMNEEYKAKILHYSYDYMIGMYGYKDFSVDVDGARWDIKGIMRASKTTGAYDLVMIPLFLCQRKPVYMGDTLYDANDSPFQVELSHTQSMIDGCSWEAPRVKVETRMTHDQLGAAWNDGCNTLRAVANAAISRAIEDGDVVASIDLEEFGMRVANATLNTFSYTLSDKSARKLVNEVLKELK